MKGLNQVFIIGNLTKDPEQKFTTGGTAVCNMAVATNEKFKNKAGEWAEKTEYHTIVLWSKLAEIATEYLKKGSKVFVEGRLQTRSYEKDGAKKYVTEIVASDIIMLDGKPSVAPTKPVSEPISDDDIPF